MIAGLLLAAGRGRRFGADKLAAKVRGKSVIRWSAEALASAVGPIYVVVPIGSNVAGKSLSRLGVCFVENLARDEGMASSIRVGIAALPTDVEGVVIALADQPFVSAEVMRSLCARWHTGDVAAVAPTYRDGRGHPVLFGRECFAALLSIRGDVGARTVLDALGDRAALIPIDDTMPRDVDTVEDLRLLNERPR